MEWLRGTAGRKIKKKEGMLPLRQDSENE